MFFLFIFFINNRGQLTGIGGLTFSPSTLQKLDDVEILNNTRCQLYLPVVTAEDDTICIHSGIGQGAAAVHFYFDYIVEMLEMKN